MNRSMGARFGRRAALGVALGASLVTAARVGAQVICSAPHSSPTLSQSGAIRTLPPRAGWIQLSVYGQNADQRYDASGARQPFSIAGDAAFDTRSVFLTAAVGVVPGLEIWAQVPTHRLSIGGAGEASSSTGVGDLRAAARLSPELVGLDVPVAVRLGAKVPGSEFPVDATVIPLTEGQSDFEVSLESGSPLGSWPLYLFGWVGYRWRNENGKAAREPGDERFAHLALGGSVGRATWEIAADGLWGEPPIAQGLSLPRERRRLVQLLPTVGYGLGPGQLEVTGQIPLSGRNLPVAYGLSAGYRLTWGM